MKQEMLEKLRQDCINAVKMRYPNEEKIVVFGEGNADAYLVLVGEAPGEKETKYVKPFAGAAGKNLDEFLNVLNLKREEIYITNTVKFRPYEINPKTGRISNRTPNKEEIELCLPFLHKQLEVIKPSIVVTLGNIALKALTKDDKITIGESHGMLIKTKDYDIFPLYHPASIIYNIKLKDVYLNDLKRLKDFIKKA